MACVNEPLLSAYLDGALLPGELDVVVGHLESCPACLRQFHDLKATRAMLRTMPLVEPPSDLIAAVGVGPWDGAPVDGRTGHPADGLSAYLDGELNTAESETLATHLGSCSMCRIELQELDAARTAVRALPRLDPPDLSLPIRRSTREADAEAPRPGLRFVAGIAGAAAAVVVTVALFGGSSEPPAVDIDQLVVHHNARQSVEAGFSVIPAIATEPNR